MLTIKRRKMSADVDVQDVIAENALLREKIASLIKKEVRQCFSFLSSSLLFFALSFFFFAFFFLSVCGFDWGD